MRKSYKYLLEWDRHSCLSEQASISVPPNHIACQNLTGIRRPVRFLCATWVLHYEKLRSPNKIAADGWSLRMFFTRINCRGGYWINHAETSDQ